MFSTSAPAPTDNAHTEHLHVRVFKSDRDEFVEPMGCRNRGARGAVTGIVLGTVLWGAILALAGIMKL